MTQAASYEWPDRPFDSPHVTGVYSVADPSTGLLYIGASRDVFQRWALHRSHLKHGVHVYQHQLADAWKAQRLQFKLLEETSSDVLQEAEQRWIDHFIDLFPDHVLNKVRSRYPFHIVRVRGGPVLSATKLRAARERAVLSQLELARAAKVSRQTVARLEAGDDGQPFPATIRKLAKALGVRPHELLGNDND